MQCFRAHLSTSTCGHRTSDRNILTHPCHPCHYLSRFYSFDGFKLGPCLNTLQAALLDEPEFALKMLSKLSLIIFTAASIILNPEEEEKKGKGKQTGLMLSDDLCVWGNVAGNLLWNFYFTD